MGNRILEPEQYGSDEQEKAELIEQLEGWRTIITDPSQYTIEELRGMVKANETKAVCDWCQKKLTNDTLYNWTGFESYVGPICNQCVADFCPHNWETTDNTLEGVYYRYCNRCELVQKLIDGLWVIYPHTKNDYADILDWLFWEIGRDKKGKPTGYS